MGKENEYSIEALVERAELLQNNKIKDDAKFLDDTGDKLAESVRRVFGVDGKVYKTLQMLRSVLYGNNKFTYEYQCALRGVDRELFDPDPPYRYASGYTKPLFSVHFDWLFIHGGLLACNLLTPGLGVFVQHAERCADWPRQWNNILGGSGKAREHVKDMLDCYGRKVAERVSGKILTNLDESLDDFMDRTCLDVKRMLDKVEASQSKERS